MRRRALLAAVGGLAGASAFAGCLAGPGVTDTPVQTPPPDPSTTEPDPVTPADQTFAVEDRSCGTGRNEATVSFGSGSVAVDGVIGGRDTCDTAELAAARLEAGTLTLTVAVVEEDPTATVACGQCLTDIDYAYRATDLDDAPSRVRVRHRTADGERTVAVADRP